MVVLQLHFLSVGNVVAPRGGGVLEGAAGLWQGKRLASGATGGAG